MAADPANPYAPLLHAEALIAQLGPSEEKGQADAAVTLLERRLRVETTLPKRILSSDA
jgi:hypothetical protein